MSTAVAGAVLVGGGSRRMGIDKAFIEVAGEPMVSRVVASLFAAGCSPVWCQGGNDEQLQCLGLVVVSDSAPGEGPLLAIRDSLRNADGDDLLVVACDLVDLTAPAVALVLSAPLAKHHVAVAVADGAPHLLCKWSASALPLLEWIISEGVRSFKGALRMLDVLEVEVPAASVRNVNTPADL